MGCSLIVERDGCDCNSLSYLVDGVSPDIDTSTSDWASQLVTVRRNEGTADILLDHALLTFGFDTAVSLTGIEIDLFHCPDLRIGAPLIRVYLNGEYDLTFSNGLTLLRGVVPSESRCDSLSSFTISETSGSLYRVVHILITFPDSNIDWVYVGEVRFLGSSDTGVILLMVKDCSLCIIPLSYSKATMSTTVFSSSHISPSNTHNAADMTPLLSGTVEPSKLRMVGVGRICIPIRMCLVFHSLPQFLEREEMIVHVVRRPQL